MDKKSASHFKNHVEAAIRELTLALSLAQEAVAPEESATIRKSIAYIIVAMDEMLHESIYPDHPELNHLRADDDGSGCSCHLR
jgi:hypothetical protein